MAHLHTLVWYFSLSSWSSSRKCLILFSSSLRVSSFIFSCWSCWPLGEKIWAATWQNQQNECAPSKDSDQPGHLPSLIRVFAVRMKKSWSLSYPLNAQQRLWSDWVDTQSDLSLCWAHIHFVGFVMSWLIWHITWSVPQLGIYNMAGRPVALFPHPVVPFFSPVTPCPFVNWSALCG